MKRELRDRWVEYLKDKKKARRKMINPHRTDQLCCLGHLCVMEGIDKKRLKGKTMPTNNFLRKIGLSYTLAGTLAELNDTNAGFPIDAIMELPVED
jgi:hypothetical protein